MSGLPPTPEAPTTGSRASGMARAVSGTAGTKIAALALGLLLNIVLARVLAPEGFGAYAVALTAVMLATMPLRTALAMLLAREIPAHVAGGDLGALRGLLRGTHALALVYCLVVVLAAVVAWAAGAGRGQLELWGWALALVPLYALAAARGAVLTGLHRAASGQFAEHVLRPALLVAAVLLAPVLWPRLLTPAGAMALHVAVMVVAVAFGAWLARRALPPTLAAHAPRYDTAAWLRALGPFALLAAVQAGNATLPVLFLGASGQAAEAGLYRAAEQFASLVTFAMIAVNLVLGPRLAEAFFEEDRAEGQRLVRWSARASLLAATPLALVFVFGGAFVLRWLYGAPFVAAAPALAVLAAAALVNAACGPTGVILNMAGKERESLRAVGAGLATTALACVLLAPKYGALGAACASALGTVVWNAVLVHRSRVLTGLSPTAFSRGAA
jgi:O-antigen/teichoic acid export membrane protein